MPAVLATEFKVYSICFGRNYLFFLLTCLLTMLHLVCTEHVYVFTVMRIPKLLQFSKIFNSLQKTPLGNSNPINFGDNEVDKFLKIGGNYQEQWTPGIPGLIPGVSNPNLL